MKPLVGVVYGDPGGKAALEPVVKVLEADGAVDVLLGYSGNTDFLLMGTSDKQGWEDRQALMKAYETGAPILAVMDFWSNYRERFYLLPDKIAIIDEQMRDEMVAVGFEPDTLVITGQPAFDILPRQRAIFDHERRQITRRGLGIHPDSPFILFCSQPIAALGYDWGYTEHDVIPLLVEAVGDVCPEAHILIRPHPRERLDNVYKYERCSGPRVTIRRSETPSKYYQLMAADLVVGMNSEILVESCYLGCVTLSLQPGLKGQDLLPTNRTGSSQVCYHADKVKDMVSLMLKNEQARRIVRRNQELYTTILEPAAPKVARLVYQMLGVEHE